MGHGTLAPMLARFFNNCCAAFLCAMPSHGLPLILSGADKAMAPMKCPRYADG